MNNQKDFPTIDINSLYFLREITEEDYKDFYQYFADPEVNKYILSDIPKDLKESVGEVKYWNEVYKQGYGIYWAIARKDNKKLIGTIGLNNWSKRNSRIELSYDLSKDYWRKGIMSSALKKVLQYAFERMSINRIEAVVLSENIDSFYLLENNGFKNEGLLRSYRYHKNKYHDLNMFSIIRKDYI